MFDRRGGAGLTALASVRDLLTTLDQDVTDDVRIDRIRVLEELRGAVAAAQAVETVAFVKSQKELQRSQGVPADRVGRGVAAQVGLARRMSPFHASRYVGQVNILTAELPKSFARMAAGEVPESRVLLVAKQTAWLSRDDRMTVDAEVAPQLHRLGNRRTIDTVDKHAYRLDPHGYMDRLTHVESERHVSLRPASECMARLTAFVPMKQGVAALAALSAQADSTVGHGDEARSRGQVMADTLVERLTGQAAAGDVPVEVNLIMTDQTLFNYGTGADEPAHVIGGGGVIPSELARRMVTDPSGDTEMFLRKLYAAPHTGQLAAMESKSRLFTKNQRKYLVLRDHTCRTLYCDAPIRHADHIRPAHEGGPTSIVNGGGTCEACNHTKQAPGWRQTAARDGTITTTTPTGHRYQSRTPDPPGRRPYQSPVEARLAELILAAA